MLKILKISLVVIALSSVSYAQTELIDDTRQGLVAEFDFNGTIHNLISSQENIDNENKLYFSKGLTGKAISLSGETLTSLLLQRGNQLFSLEEDFSVQFWIRTGAKSDEKFVLLSQKHFPDNSLLSQKKSGWVFFVSNGTWAWNLGTGDRRLTYERDNGQFMPVNDGRWHQLTMTYQKEKSVIRLYFDGQNKVTYNVQDSEGFNFNNSEPLRVGWNKDEKVVSSEILPAILDGAKELQKLVDAFNKLGLEKLQPDELISLVIAHEELYTKKLDILKQSKNPGSEAQLQALSSVDLTPISELSLVLMNNPYTIHQSAGYMNISRLGKVYSLEEGKIKINQDAAEEMMRRERLSNPDFDMENLNIWQRALSNKEIENSYNLFFQPVKAELAENITSLTAAAWNIHHGGIHETIKRNGWDSRNAIIDIIKKENIDVVMMQETYSNGDYIAAALGYYFATTVDRDYLNQGSNISVLSRYPINEVNVPPTSPFMNVAAKIALSKTQEIYAMSNWYGMPNFNDVANFHQIRFEQANSVPVLFAGDFNAVPHIDGGTSLASETLLGQGFTDAYRSFNPDVKKFPGFTHNSDVRIDQLYFKGEGLKHNSTKIIKTWPSRFPSDHFLIKSKFTLDFKP